jgi:hypothetical protein
MDDKLRQTLIDDYNSLLADMQSDNIKRLELGFISDYCVPMLFSILIHCMENIEVFNSTQLNNISNFINKLSYVG